MASRGKHPSRGETFYVDAAGRRTDDPAQAVAGEITERAHHGRPPRRIRFFLDRSELPWLPVSESALLLWVLVMLLIVWTCIGVALRFL